MFALCGSSAFPQPHSPFRGPLHLSAARCTFPQPGAPFRSPARLYAAGVGYYVAGAYPAPVFYVPAHGRSAFALCGLSAFPRPGAPFRSPARLSATRRRVIVRPEHIPPRSFMFRQTRTIGVCFERFVCLSAARLASSQPDSPLRSRRTFPQPARLFAN